MDGTVYMAFGGEVNDSAGPVALQDIPDQVAIANVAVDEVIPRVSTNRFEVSQITRVGQLVEIGEGSLFGRKPMQDEIRPDKAGSAGDDYRVIHSRFDFKQKRREAAALLAPRNIIRFPAPPACGEPRSQGSM
jgi:hypothetical protein